MEVTAIILAGGKSTRMGEDKGLMKLDGKLMIQYVIDVLKQITNQIIIISNNLEYEQLGYPVFADEIKGKGPLAGIYTGLLNSKTSLNLVLSCDVPYIKTELLEFLIEKSQGYDVTIPEKDGQTHQLIGVFDKSCEEGFKSAIDNNCLKLISAYESLNLNVVDANQFDEKLFRNINTKNDIEA